MRTINFTFLAALSCMIAMMGAIPIEPKDGVPAENTQADPDQPYVFFTEATAAHGEGRGNMNVLT